MFVAVLTVALLAPAQPPPPPRPPRPLWEWPQASAPATLAPAPRDKGRPAPPPYAAEASGLAPEVLAAWVGMLGDETWAVREDAHKRLVAAGWDGYTTCLEVVRTTTDPEIRARARAVCGHYLRGVLPTDPTRPPVNIYTLANRYAPPQVIAPGGKRVRHWNYDRPLLDDEYPRAVVAHYYLMKAFLVEREAARSAGVSVGAEPPVYTSHYYFQKYESRATNLMVNDLLASGVSRAWVQWLIDDMEARESDTPKSLPVPPKWLLRLMGVESPPYLHR